MFGHIADEMRCIAWCVCSRETMGNLLFSADNFFWRKFTFIPFLCGEIEQYIIRLYPRPTTSRTFIWAHLSSPANFILFIFVLVFRMKYEWRKKIVYKRNAFSCMSCAYNMQTLLFIYVSVARCLSHSQHTSSCGSSSIWFACTRFLRI